VTVESGFGFSSGGAGWAAFQPREGWRVETHSLHDGTEAIFKDFLGFFRSTTTTPYTTVINACPKGH
jgi:hypothetical protein